MKHGINTSRSGFTLIEAMLATLVLSITLMATFQLFFSTARSNARAQEFVSAHQAAETHLEWVREVAMMNVEKSTPKTSVYGLEMAYRIFNGVSADDICSEPDLNHNKIMDGQPPLDTLPNFVLHDMVIYYTDSYCRDVENRYTKLIKQNGIVIGRFPKLPPDYFYSDNLPPLINTNLQNGAYVSAYDDTLSVPFLPQGEIIVGARVPFAASIKNKTRCVISEQPTPVMIGGQSIYPFADLNMDGVPENFDWIYKESINLDETPDKSNPYTDRMYWDTTDGTFYMIANGDYESGGSPHPDFDNSEYYLYTLPVAVRVSWTPYGGNKNHPATISVKTTISHRESTNEFNDIP